MIENLALPVGGIVADIDVVTMAAAEARLDAAGALSGASCRAHSATLCSWRSPPSPTTPSPTSGWWGCVNWPHSTRSSGQPERNACRSPGRTGGRESHTWKSDVDNDIASTRRLH